MIVGQNANPPLASRLPMAFIDRYSLFSRNLQEYLWCQTVYPWENTMTETLKLAVNGTLMRGLALNDNLLNVGAEFLYDATTSPNYRLWSIHDIHPAMVRVSQGGTAVALEVWAVPATGLIQVLQQEPPGLCVGKVKLNTGEEVLGVLGEPVLCEGQPEITSYGGWRAYIESRQNS
jgi:hypothetical protein